MEKEIIGNDQSINTNTQSVSAPQSNNSIPTSKTNLIKPKTLILSLIVLILLGGLLYGGYRYLNLQKQNSSSQQSNNALPSITGQQPSISPVVQSGNINWLPSPQKVVNVGFFTLIDPHYPYQLSYIKGNETTPSGIVKSEYEPKATYYLLGSVNSGQYKGGSVYLATVKGLPNAHVFKGIPTEKDIVNDLTQSYLFIKMPDNTFVVTSDYSNASLFCQSAYCDSSKTFITGRDKATGIKIDKELSLDKIGSNYEYTDLSSGIKFNINRSNDLFDKTGLYLVKDLGNNSELFSNQDIHSNPIKLKTIINPTFVIKLPTGLIADVQIGSYSTGLVYQNNPQNNYNPYSDTQQLNWTGASKPQLLPKEPTNKGMVTDYKAIRYMTDYDGCTGTLKLEGVTSDAESLDTQNNLIQIATTSKGDSIYDIKDKNYKIFQSFWFAKVQENGLGDVLDYNNYLALEPILIWKSPLGVYRMVFREDLVSSKCWGEPLIYLYPEKKTNVQVKLSDVINLTESEPAYNSQWNVIAYPDGKMFDITKQRYYPYLYWEGSAPIGYHPVISGIVAQKDIHTYFTTQLTRLGLNDKEKDDFENYWEPKLQNSPYYQVSFYDAEELNKIAPLTITPKPDTIIRILMSYERLNGKIDSPNLNTYATPLRKGFTVVEWGGILHK